MINLSLAKLFVKVAQLGSIAAAARALDIAPSIANRQIALLERTLKTKLMIRTTRQLSLTEAGQAMLEWAKVTTESYEKLADDIGAMQERPSGTISIACSDFAATTYLPNILRLFCEKYPGIRLRISTSASPVELVSGTYDLMIHAGRMTHESFVGRIIARYRRGLYASPAYIARKGKPETLAELAEHDCLAYPSDGTHDWTFTREGEGTIKQPVAALVEADNYISLKQMALMGMGIARLTDLAVDEEVANGKLVQVLDGYLSVHADGEMAAVWIGFPDRQILARTRLFANFLVEEFERSRPARRASSQVPGNASTGN